MAMREDLPHDSFELTARHQFLAFGRVPRLSVPAGLGFRLPKAVEQNGRFAGAGDAGALWSSGRSQRFAPRLQRKGPLDRTS
ncbi:hypothetical protein ABTH94_19500, partial [Acinetobacter baumannii]